MVVKWECTLFFIGDGKGPCKKTYATDLSWIWKEFDRRNTGREGLELIKTDGDLQTWKFYEDLNEDAMGGVFAEITKIWVVQVC